MRWLLLLRLVRRMQCLIPRIVLRRQETTFRIRHLGEVMVHIFLEFPRGLDALVFRRYVARITTTLWDGGGNGAMCSFSPSYGYIFCDNKSCWSACRLRFCGLSR